MGKRDCLFIKNTVIKKKHKKWASFNYFSKGNIKCVFLGDFQNF